MHFDFVVIGAGIAGASVAAHLAQTHKVLVIEAEEQPGFHSTGRSAALFSEAYGPQGVRAISRASRAFFYSPQPEFSDQPLISPRGFLSVADGETWGDLQAFGALPEVEPLMRSLSVSEIMRICPILRPELLAGGLFETDAADIDVNSLHLGYLKLFRHRSGVLITDARVEGLSFGSSGWTIHCGARRFSGDTIINAAGAWADQVGAMAGASPIGLEPKRRTAILVDAPSDRDITNWPLVYNFREHFYFKPDAGNLLLSPGDETLSEPVDAQPEELDVAIAVDRFTTSTTLDVKRVKGRWAGLRCFVADGEPVVGYDLSCPHFFWLAGQGGYGIQTAPALSRIAAALAKCEPLPRDIEEYGVTAANISPARLHHAPLVKAPASLG